MTDAIVTAGSGQSWESELVGVLTSDPGPLVLLRRCVDVGELVSVTETGQVAAVVVDADLRRLSSDVIGRIAGGGVAVVGVYPAAEEKTQQVLQRMGVTVAVGDDHDPVQLIDVIRTAILSSRLDPAPEPGWSAPAGRTARALIRQTDELGAVSEPVGADPADPDREGAGACFDGAVIAVWGPAGGPGRSTVALNLAAELAERTPTLLIDADPYGGVVATAFGLLDESPGLAGACRLAAHGRLDGDRLIGLCWQVGALRVLTGITRADRWPELRPSAVPTILSLARRQAQAVVVDVGFNLEADEELSFDTSAPRRNGVTLAVLEAADVVLAVGAADPPGMERLVRGLSELTSNPLVSSPRVVLNRQRRTAASAAEADAAVGRFTGLGVLAVLPEDRAGTDAAWAAGTPLLTAAPRSSLRSGIRSLAEQLVPAARTTGASSAP